MSGRAAPPPDGGRPNPQACDGALVWWVGVPTSEQNYLQAVLEGYDDLGYYQTFPSGAGKNEGARPVAIGRLTSSADARADVEALLDALAEEVNLHILDATPPFGPAEQPRSMADASG